MKLESPVTVEMILCNGTYTLRSCPGELWRALCLAANKRRIAEIEKLNLY